MTVSGEEALSALLATGLGTSDPNPVEELEELPGLLQGLQENDGATAEVSPRPAEGSGPQEETVDGAVDSAGAGTAGQGEADRPVAEQPSQCALTALDGTLAGPDEARIRREVERALSEERDRLRWVRKPTGRVHLARSYSSRLEVPPEDWRTCCGWAFGRSLGAVRSADPPGPGERLCGRGCFAVAESMGLLPPEEAPAPSEGEGDRA